MALAFGLRLCVRLSDSSNSEFWANGYTFFFDIAQGIAAGQGIAVGGTAETFRVPLYPLLLAALTFGHSVMLPVVIAQSILGAGIVLIAAALARRLCSGCSCDRAATLAAAITAIYPYYVVHDTSLEETSLFTFLTIAAVALLMKAADPESTGRANIAAGVLLGLDVLTRASIAPFAALAPLWLLWRKGARAGIACGITVMLLVAPWLWRNYKLIGSPTLSSEAGELLWTGNNGFLFKHYPQESSDLSKEEALQALTPQDRNELQRLSNSDLATDRWFQQKALLYIETHPWQTIKDGLRKNVAAFSWLPSPRHSRIANLLYSATYGPLMLFGLWGMWRRHAQWREDSLIYLGFATFMLMTAAFWAHTSHRSYLDVYWICFGSAGIAQAMSRNSIRILRKKANANS